jgi:hypothetical protein
MARMTVQDMLSPVVRVSREVQVSRMSELLAELTYDSDLYRVNVIRNGVVMNPADDFEILDSDFVAVQLVPARDLLRSVAMIAAVAVSTAIIGPWAAGVIGWTTKVGVAVMTAVAVAATAALVNAVLPPSAADRESGAFGDRSGNYGWGVRSNTAKEGEAVPRLFGELTFAPKLISRYIETIGDKQYFNGLYLVNDAAVDWIDRIQLNHTDQGAYEGVSVETRYGAIDQPVISSFDAVRSDTPVGTRLEHGVNVEASTVGNSVEAIRINLTFPNGLYQIDMDGKDAGEQEDAQWTVYTAYSGDGGESWLDFAPPQVYNANTRSPLRRSIVRDGLPKGAYIVRVMATYDNELEGSVHPSQLWFDFLQEETSDQLTYPGRALLSIKALATDKLNGSEPLVECRARAGSSNPADICLTMLSECNVPAQKIDVAAFEEWRQECVARSFNCDIYLDTLSSLRECLDMVSILGRARVERFGSRYSVIMDKPGQLPVQGFTFGVGNIDRGSFGIDTIPVSNRANVIDVTYYPDDTRNQREMLEVASESYNTDEQERRASVNFVGCKSLSQAKRHANYLLKCNQYLTIMPHWGADLDAIVARVGDIVAVSHDIPSWGESGLIVGGSVSGVTLDRDVSMEVGKTYAVQIRDSDDNTIAERAVVWDAGPTAVLVFVTPFPFVPAFPDSYAFGEVQKVSKLVRLTAVQTTGVDMRRQLVALEYLPEVYDDAATVTSQESVENFGITRLMATDYLQYAKDGSIDTVLQVSWRGSSLAYTFSYKGPDDDAYHSVSVADTMVSVSVSRPGVYLIRVDDGRGHLSEMAYTVRGKTAPPGNVSWTLVEDGRLLWGPVPDIDLLGYRVRYNYGTSTDWALAAELLPDMVFGSPIQLPVSIYGLVTLLIKAVDTTGNESLEACTCTVDQGSFIPANVLLLVDQDAQEWPGELLGGALDAGFPKATGTSLVWSAYPEVRMWLDDPNVTMWDDQYGEMVYTASVEIHDYVPGARITLDYGWEGYALRVEYRRVGDGMMWQGYDTLEWATDSATAMWPQREFTPWPGQSPALIGGYEVRFVVSAGRTQGALPYLIICIDKDDVTEYLDNVTVPSAGRRLPVTRQYQVIKTVHCQMVSGGGTQIQVELIDKNTDGPLVRCRQQDGTYIDGIVDAIITGY